MFLAMFSMVTLTLLVGCAALKVRFASVKNGQVSPKYYKLMEGDVAPEIVIKTTRCFNNQFETPVLFYVVCTLYISLGIDSFFAIVCAWLFVSFRVLHAAIHLTYNHVIHRMLVFCCGLICVLALWINLIITIPKVS